MADFAETETTPADELQWYFEQAESGDEKAMRELGRMYLKGFTHPDDESVEVQPDAELALSFLGQAVELGGGDAALLLGELFEGEATGGFFDEPEKAVMRYQQAVDLGSELARFHLATRYLIGRGVERDEQRGREIMIEAAYRGIIDAQNFFGPNLCQSRRRVACGRLGSRCRRFRPGTRTRGYQTCLGSLQRRLGMRSIYVAASEGVYVAGGLRRPTADETSRPDAR